MRILKNVLIYGALVSCFVLATSVNAQDETLTNADIISLTKAAIDKAVIVNKIRSTNTKFDLSTDALIQLKQAGVANEVVTAMFNPKASIAPAEPQKPARLKDELTTSYNRLKNTVVTVLTENSTGTGFIIDDLGLIVTNQHVVGPSEYLAVQFDPQRKIAATLLAANPEKDIAVLWVNMEALPNAKSAPIAKFDSSEPAVSEGERVFTIGSPLNQSKIITTGIISKVEERALISDININHGNSGGPLFNSLGEVVGVTTFGDTPNYLEGQGGPGISGVVRMEQALPIIDEARRKMATTTKPSPKLLLVDPTDTFPLNAITEIGTVKKFDFDRYFTEVGEFTVYFRTPSVEYRYKAQAEIQAQKEQEKRTKKKESQQKEFHPFENLHGWAEYIGDYKPILVIKATPQHGESFWGGFGRRLAANYGIHTQANYRFKTDFYRMRLLCGDKEIEPIHPGKQAYKLRANDYFVRMNDASYVGLYTYPANAISPLCRKVTLELFSLKEPTKAKTKVLDEKTVSRIAADFAPYLATKKVKSEQGTTDAAPQMEKQMVDVPLPVAVKAAPLEADKSKTQQVTERAVNDGQKETVAPPPPSNISVKSTPDGADIEIDGKFVGSTPSTVQLAMGDHKITVKKKGYTVWKRTITLSESNIVVDASLEKEPPPVPVSSGAPTLSTQPLRPAPVR